MSTSALRINGVRYPDGTNAPAVFNVKDPIYGAKGDGATDDTAAVQAAITAAVAAGGGVVFFPQSSTAYRGNWTLAAKSSVAFVGGSRRGVTIQPFTNAPVFTLDSTSGSMQGVTFSNLSFTAGASTSSAISIVGTNINDWHRFESLWFNGFTNTINITGRTIWSVFDHVEIANDLARGFVVTGTAVVNDLQLYAVRVASCASDGFYFNCTGGTQSVYLDIVLDGCNSEANTGHGIVGTNVDAFTVRGCYIENNGAANDGILFNGTWARALDICGNIIQGQGHGIVNTATLTTGIINGNYLTNTTDNISITTTHADSHLTIGANYESNLARVLTVDGNGLTHVSSIFPLTLEYNSETGIPTTARNKNIMRFTQGGDITVSNITGADAGQLLEIWVNGAGSVTLTSQAGGAGQIVPAINANMVLPTGSSILLHFDGSNWRPADQQTATRVGRNTVTYSASMTPDASLGEVNVIAATNGTAFTINAPTHPALNQKLTIQIRNTSGGALGVATFNAAFKMATWTQPANANSRAITFVYDGTNWIEVGRTTADVPN